MREKKKTIIRSRKEEPREAVTGEVNNYGYNTQDEAVAPADVATPEPAAEVESVSAPVLHGKKRVGKGPKKFESETDNKQSREEVPELDAEKPDLDDGKPELED